MGKTDRWARRTVSDPLACALARDRQGEGGQGRGEGRARRERCRLVTVEGYTNGWMGGW